MNLGNLLSKNARRLPDKEALVCEDKRFSFKELNHRTNRLANALVDMDVRKGDFVSVLARNIPEWVEIYFAMCKVGAVIAPLIYRLPQDEMEALINQCRSVAFIFSTEFTDRVNAIRPNLKFMQHYIVTGGEGPEYAVKYPDIMMNYPTSEPGIEVNEDDGALLNYTSGTTGLPKPSIHTHRSMMEGANIFIIDKEYMIDDVIGVAFAMYGGIANTQMNAAVAVGAKQVVFNFTPKRCLELIEKEKITSIDLAATMIGMMLEEPDLDKYDASSLRAIYNIGAPLPSAIREGTWKRFGPVAGEYYGTTETHPIVVMKPSMKVKKPDSCGEPAFGVEMRIVNDKDEDVPQGEIGEVIARGFAIKADYLWFPGHAEATARTMRGGWFHTQDLGRVDDDGYLYLSGRTRDMILSGAQNIFAPKVEDVIQSHPKVLEVAVIGIPHKLWGEAVTAIVAPKKGEEVTEEEIVEYTKGKLASWECPKFVRSQDSLPRNPTGKVLKHELVAKYSKIAEESGQVV